MSSLEGGGPSGGAGGRGDGHPGFGRHHHTTGGHRRRHSGEPVRAFLALGANQGTPILNLKRAVHMLAAESGIDLLDRSSIYETLPVGPPGQPNYFNAVVAVDTTLEPRQLLRRIQAIETGLGRVRTNQHWMGRTMDIDILLYGDRTVVDGHLSIPHPRIGERDFVVIPLLEIAPSATYPGGRPVTLSPHEGRTVVRRVDGAWQ